MVIRCWINQVPKGDFKVISFSYQVNGCSAGLVFVNVWHSYRNNSICMRRVVDCGLWTG